MEMLRDLFWTQTGAPGSHRRQKPGGERSAAAGAAQRARQGVAPWSGLDLT